MKKTKKTAQGTMDWEGLQPPTNPFSFSDNTMDDPPNGLRTPNEGINQRYLKNWDDVADKICCRHT